MPTTSEIQGEQPMTDQPTTTAAPTVHSLAADAAGWFTTVTRREGEEITVTKDGRPDWLTDLIRTAHGDMLPDDWRYKVIGEALDAIADAGPQADLDDVGIEFEDDVDVYTHELIAWMGSRADRHAYVDEAREEYGPDASTGVMGEIALGQARERAEIFASVRTSLEAMAAE